MKMKKTIALTVLMMFLLSSVCLAFTPDPNRWEWIASNDKLGFFYDKSTVEYYDSGNTCDVWIMTVEPAKGTYMKDHMIIKKNRTAALLSVAEYSIRTGKLLNSAKAPYPRYEDIIPDTFGETIYDRLFYGR